MQNNQVYAPGSGLIKVMGIIYIISGSLAALFALIAFATADAAAAAIPFGLGGGIAAQLRLFAFLSLLAAAWGIFVGGMGVTHCENLGKAEFLRNIVIAEIVLGIVVALVTGTFAFWMVLFYIVPALYIVGANKNIEAYALISMRPQANNSSAFGASYATPQVTTQVPKEQTAAPAGTAPLIRRAFMLLEDGEWDKANELLEQILNSNPECARAYIGKLCIELRLNREDDLLDYEHSIADNSNYKRAMRFSDENYRKTLASYLTTPEERQNEQREKEALYHDVLSKIEYIKGVKARKDLAEYTRLVPELTSKIKQLGDYKGIQQELTRLSLSPTRKGMIMECPLCGSKHPSSKNECSECGLVFSD